MDRVCYHCWGVSENTHSYTYIYIQFYWENPLDFHNSFCLWADNQRTGILWRKRYVLFFFNCIFHLLLLSSRILSGGFPGSSDGKESIEREMHFCIFYFFRFHM